MIWLTPDLKESRDQLVVCSKELWSWVKRIFIIADVGMILSEEAMGYLAKHRKAHIVASLLKRQPTEIARHIGHTTVWRVIICDPSSSPPLNFLDFLYVFETERAHSNINEDT